MNVVILETVLQRYRDSQASECPVCGSGDLSGGSFDIDNGEVASNIFCGGCGSEWDDVYTLSRIENLKLGQP